MSKNRQLVVGAISSHGHELGHVSVLEQLDEVGEIHVCAATDLVNVEELAGTWPGEENDGFEVSIDELRHRIREQ